ncbi:MAG: PAS domain S-box protein [Nitrospinae bacterium]|nr:PAS domain S-box protein [Nitrospinota bacterium]
MNRGVILAVDDNLESLRLLTDILTGESYQVRPANSGELALASVAASPPELILLDIRMPGMDGFDALRRIKAREECRAIPVIFLSAATETQTRVEGFKLGAVDFISKPFQRDELLARVQTHLELSRLRSRLKRQADDLRVSNEQLQAAKTAELAQAEALLRESKLRFRATFEQAAVGIAHVGPDGHFLDVNQKLCDIVGYTREELLSLTFQQITHPDDLDLDLSYTRQLLAGEIPNFSMEKRYLKKNGEIVWVDLTVAMVRNASGDPDYFIGVVEDISGRKLAEERLGQSEERFRTLVETADDAIILMDMNFNRIYENESSWAGLGYTLEEWKKLGPWQERIHPDDIAEIKEKTSELFRTGLSVSKYRIMRRDGQYATRLAKSKVIHMNGKPVSVLAILRDVTEMERAEAALRESERKYRQLTEQASEGIFVVDRGGRYLEVNPAGLEMVGYSLEELRGMTIPNLMPPEELKKAPSRFPEILAGKTVVSERMLRRKDGSVFLAEITAKLMPDGYVLATKRDITERKRREEEKTAHIHHLMSLNRVYRAFDPTLDLETSLPVALTEILSIFESDRAFLLHPLDKAAKTYTIPFEQTKPEYPGAFTANKELPVTKEVAEIFKTVLEASAPVSMNLVDGITDEARLKEFDIKTQLVVPLFPKTGKPWMLGMHQCSHVREWTKEEKELFHAISLVISDKLSNLLLVKDLGESEEILERIFATTHFSVILLDTKFNFIRVNRAYADACGYDADYFIGKNHFSLYPSEELESEFQRVVQTGEPYTVYSRPFEWPDQPHLGVTYWDLAVYPVKKASGEVEGLLFTLLEVTERVRAEKALIAAKEQAERANKAKSVFLSSMSHEIRTPLTSVIGFSQLLATDAEHPLSEFQRQLLGKVMVSGDQLLELINSALDLARIESGDIEVSIEPVDMKSVAMLALTSSAHLARECGVRLASKAPSVDCCVMADSILLRQVLTNLLSNAIKFNRKDGETILSWSPLGENKVRISVSDEGFGISVDKIKDLYKPFDRLGMEGQKIKGFGVGLAIVKRLVDSMGGVVGVKSEVGKGSTFFIDLPAGKNP